MAIRLHPWKIFTEIVPGEPLRWGVKRKRSDHIWHFDGYISQTVQAGKLLLITDMKSYVSFRLVPKSVTVNDLERRNGPYFALFMRSNCLAII